MKRKPLRLRQITIRLIEHTIEGTDQIGKKWVDVATNEAPKPGDVFYHPHARLDPDAERALSPEYRRACQKHDRYPIVVVLPGGQWWNVDCRFFDAKRGYYGDGWSVTRIPPLERMSVRPSIRTGVYHGILTKGVLVPCQDSQL